MEVEIHCESCRVALRVPYEAAGHRARCPSCGHEFQVPSMEDLLEDTVSEWIEHDVEEVLEDRDRMTEEQLRRVQELQAQQAAEAQAAKAAKAAGAADRHAAAAGQDGDGRDPKAERPERPGDTEADAASREPERDGHHDGRDRADGEHKRSRRRLWPMRTSNRSNLPGGVTLPNDRSAARPSAESLMVTPPPVSHHRESDGDPSRYPANLHVEERIPHLIVKKVDAAGVRFAFDSAWLGHEGFRASMPIRCVCSGSSSREKLIARPLVFMDRATAAAPLIDRIYSAHENRQVGDHGPRHIMRMMGLIEGLPHPFAYAMPYYVSTRYAHLQIHCQTRDRVSGGITCEVLIPDGITALDWLGRVNGVCGKDYECLEHDVGLRHGDAWAQLSEDCRGRIAAWCKLGAREMLLHYFSDADFGKRDEGLAGLVLTDQRLVFSKYHHRGQIRLDNDDTAILARGEGRFVNLSLRVGNEVQRMIKLHRHDLDRLAQALQQAGQVHLQVMQEA